jgi:type IV pilus assembly protein PilB
VERGLVTAQQVEDAIAAQQSDSKRRLLGEILVELGYCTQNDLIEALADAYEMPFVNLNSKFIDPDIISILPRSMINDQGVLPLFKVDHVLTVAVSEPSNFFLIDEIQQIAKCEVQVVAATPKAIRTTLDAIATEEVTLDFDGLLDEGSGAPDSDTGVGAVAQDIEELGGDSPVVKLVNHAIHSAIRSGASDIHFEPDEDSFRVRYRIDGHLVEKLQPPVQARAAIVARIKILAGMDISECRLPQDGSIRVVSRGNPVDLRISTLPNKYGEKVVIRIIDNSSSLLTLDGLSLPADTRASILKLCAQPYGIILVTGPTGSGKSTTLYSMLNQINDPSVNICTVEDPIEFNVKGINQFQVHPKIGLNFASVLRTLLRQDPDVIMLGEIRDPETAGIAVQAALTGHLVLSTLHTNDAASAITRLQNLSIEPYLASAALVGIVAQRLVRTVCADCAYQDTPPAGLIEAAAKYGKTITKVTRGRGCPTCNRTGNKGRTGIYEILIPDDEMRDAIASGATLGKLRELARGAGMKTLFEAGLDRILAGETTAEELFRVTSM